MIRAGPGPELVRISAAVVPETKAVDSQRSGRTESRLCSREARATYADTPSDATAMITLQTAMTVFAFTLTSRLGTQLDPGTSMLLDLSAQLAVRCQQRTPWNASDYAVSIDC